MSAEDAQKDIVNCDKDIESNVIPRTMSDNADLSGGDARNTTDENNLDSNEPKTHTLQQHISSAVPSDILKSLLPEKTIVNKSDDETTDGAPSDLGSHMNPASVVFGKTSDNDEISQKVLVQTEGNLHNADVDLLISTSNLEEVKTDKDNFENRDVPDTIGYKETVIDNVSDSDLELRWTDDDDDSQIKPLSEEALKKLDEDLNSIDADKSNEKMHEIVQTETTELNPKDGDKCNKKMHEIVQKETKKQNYKEADKSNNKMGEIVKKETAEPNPKDAVKSTEKIDEIIQKETIEQNPKVIEDITEEVGPDDKFLDDDELKRLDQELGIADDENTIDGGIDKAVEELQQLINQDDDNVQQKSKPSTPVVEDTVKVRTSVEQKDTQPMDEDGPSEIETKPSVTVINKTTLEIKVVQIPDIQTEFLQDVTEITPMPKIGNDSILTKEADDHNIVGVDTTKMDPEIKIETNDVIINEDDSTTSIANIQIDTVDTGSGHEKKMETDDVVINEDDSTTSIANIQIDSADTRIGHECGISKESNLVNSDNNTESASCIQTVQVDMRVEDVDKISKEAYNQNVDCITSSENITEQQKEHLEINTTILKKVNDLLNENAENASSVQTKKVEIKSGNEFSKDSNDHNMEVNQNTENVSEVKTHIDETNHSIKINTEHRITRPDVMLDIPTQEFDFDDETLEILETQSPVENIDKDVTNLTAKTVTEIVNQLAKDKTAERNAMKVTDIDNTVVQIDCKTSEKDTLKITRDKEKQTEKSAVKDTAALEKHSDKDSEEILEKETNKADMMTKLTDDKTTTATTENSGKQESTDNVEKQDLSSKPSTSTDVTKITPDIAEEVQEVSDSLGLLAESSRVLDDEDEEPELEEDEGEGDDDDDDFDPDYESSNQTAEHSEESNPPQSEVDIQENAIDIVFNNEADVIGLVSDSNDAEDAFNALQASDPLNESEKQSATTDNAQKPTTERRKSILSELLSKTDNDTKKSRSEVAEGKAPAKTKDLDISKPKDIVSIVDLEGSSSEDDVQENKAAKEAAPSIGNIIEVDAGVIRMPKSVLRSMSIDGAVKEAAGKDESVKDDKEKSKGEIFNLDSDDDDKADFLKKTRLGKPRENNQCINHHCLSDDSVPYYLADRVAMAYYGAARRRKRAVCQNCLDIVNSRNEGLLTGFKDLRPLMSLRMARPTHQLLEISDSDSEGEDDAIGEKVAEKLEGCLTDLLNETWVKYKMDERLKDTEALLDAELEKMSNQSREIDQMLRDCQKATDKLRVDFYLGFEPTKKMLPALILHDTPIASYARLESEEDFNASSQLPVRYSKRRASTAIETPAKKQAMQAIPLGYLENETKKITRSVTATTEQIKAEEDKDISVVRLSAELAPAELPPPGELTRPPIRANVQVYAMKNQFGAWLRGRVMEVLPKAENQYTQCRIRFDHKVKNPCKVLSARSIAYTDPSEVRMTIGTRVIALFKNSETANKRESFYYSGVIAEIPNPVNSYRYLVFFDDGYAQYVAHQHTRLVYESSALVWEEVHPFSRDFVCNYLMKYPERPMVRMHRGQTLTVEWNGKWWETKVITVDAALVKVNFPDNRTEWIYRGSTRLQPLFAEFQNARTGNRARLPRSTKASTRTNMPYVEYTRSEDQTKPMEAQTAFQTDWNISTELPWELRRQRAVAKKSTTAALQPAVPAADGVVSRVVFYTPKNSVRPYKMVPHTCGPACRRSDLLSLKELRTYNPLTKPLLSGWERQIVRHKYSRHILYRAPCGRRVRSLPELHRYLRAVRSDMAVDLFDFNPNTHCLAEFVLNKSNVQKKDLSHGKENVPVPCVNYYDHSLPEFCSYNTERTPTAGVPLNLDPEFLCGCDCEDDCMDKTKCACWKMTLEGARTIGIESHRVGYEYRRLPEPLPSGIYECNSRCKCSATCLNRVVQNPLQLKLQVFKTLNRGWGIRALNDVPKGAFLCIYAGNLLTDATANLDGLNEGDEYLAELDYIEVVEAMKEGFEEDIPEKDKILDKKESKKSESDPESDSSESEEEERTGKTDELDDDFQPGYVAFGPTVFNKRLRRRDKSKKDKADKEKEEEKQKEEKEQPGDDKTLPKNEEGDDCITISDDEEVRVSQREPSRFTAQEGMTDSKVVPKYRSIRTCYGKDEACYIMDAKVQGNIGRYLNHSCSPNVFVQNVFVDTHDPRFPWVSFFALHHIRAGTELTWNYNYDVGSVPGKVLYCFCGAPNCRGRLL